MPVVKNKTALCHVGLSDFLVESVNEVPFYKRYFEFVKLFSSKVPSVDFEMCFAQPQENTVRKIIEWYYIPGNESPMKLTEIKENAPELYDACVQQRKDIVGKIRAALANAAENEQKYLNVILINLEADYIDSITYCYDNHILIGIWGMRTKTGRQIDSVITEGVLDHRAYKVTYQVEGSGVIKPFSSINRRHGHILQGERDIPQVIPDQGYYFKEWVPEAPHGKEVKSDSVYTAVCERKQTPVDGGDGLTTPPPVEDGRNRCRVCFNAGEHGTVQGSTDCELYAGERLTREVIPGVVAKEGYRFVGWDKNPEDYIVYEDVEFTAQYEEIVKEEEKTPFIVRFNKGEHGTLKGQTQYEKYDGDKVVSDEVPDVEAEEGYRFIGWDKDPNGYMVHQDVEFTALYKESWWAHFLGWGSGCLNWLLSLLLLGLIGLLLWYLLAGFRNFNFCGCDCDEPLPPIPDTNVVVYPEGTCNEVTESGGEQGIVKHVQMGEKSGTFLFEYNTYSIVDKIEIYNGKNQKGKPIFKYEGGTHGVISENVTFNSSDGYITIVVTGSQPGTDWVFKVNCPGQEPSNPNGPVDPPDPPVMQPCDELIQSGSNSPESFVFDMGQMGGSFVFEYATGAVYPDLIIIYDGDSKSGKEIFRYNGVTGDDGWNNSKKQKVVFSQSKVFIEVIPDGSDKTWWQIKANCP